MKIPGALIHPRILLYLSLPYKDIQSSKMNLIIDAGNTQIKWAIYSDKQQLLKKTIESWSELQVESLVSRYPSIKSIIISSVRKIPVDIYDSLQDSFSHIVELNHQLKLPISIKYKTPETLGKDRIAAAVGGAALFPGNYVFVIDLGTAITLDLINENAQYLGGNISPGMQLRFKALGHFTDDLPLVSPKSQTKFLGQTTNEAIQAGVQQGITYELDAYINTLVNKYNGLRVILTGGDAPVFVKKLKNTIFVVPNLVLDGLNLILEFQKEQYLGL